MTYEEREATSDLTSEEVTAESSIGRLMKDPRYWDASHPDHHKVVAEVSDLYRSRYPEEGGKAPVHLNAGDVGELRRLTGVTLELPPQVEREQWNTDDEAEFLRWSIRENIPTSSLQSIYEWYSDRLVMSTIEGAEAEQEFRTFARTQGLTSKQTEELIAWHRGA